MSSFRAVARALLVFVLVCTGLTSPLPVQAAASDPTATSISCEGRRTVSPSATVSCTAAVKNTASGATAAPLGTVTWSILSGSGSLASTSCGLAGTGTTTTCSVNFTASSTTGLPVLKAAYPGSSSTSASFGTLSLGVCSGGSPSITVDGNTTDWACTTSQFTDNP